MLRGVQQARGKQIAFSTSVLHMKDSAKWKMLGFASIDLVNDKHSIQKGLEM